MTVVLYLTYNQEKYCGLAIPWLTLLALLDVAVTDFYMHTI